jgi:hypothetical protein
LAACAGNAPDYQQWPKYIDMGKGEMVLENGCSFLYPFPFEQLRSGTSFYEPEKAVSVPVTGHFSYFPAVHGRAPYPE